MCMYLINKCLTRRLANVLELVLVHERVLRQIKTEREESAKSVSKAPTR